MSELTVVKAHLGKRHAKSVGMDHRPYAPGTQNLLQIEVVELKTLW